jgi:hypothetical protein
MSVGEAMTGVPDAFDQSYRNSPRGSFTSWKLSLQSITPYKPRSHLSHLVASVLRDETS